MRDFRPLWALAVVMMAGLTGCFRTTHVVQKVLAPDMYRTASVGTLEQELSARDAALHTLNASVLITASTGGAKEGTVTQYTAFRGYIFVQKPGMLRVILQLPVLGSRAMDMVSDGKTFTLLIPPRNKVIEGTNAVTKPSKNGLENLRPAVFLDSLLVPGLSPDEFVTLTESTRVIEPESKHKDAVEEPDYDITVLEPQTGNIMTRERVVHISRITMLPYEQDTYENDRVVTLATYNKYQEFNGEQFPTVITIQRPLDEYSLKIVVTKLTLNAPFESDQFELKIPAGAAVQKVE
jgi:outer membrane lipoprotein-sorting protein